jgi:hypothetical protein
MDDEAVVAEQLGRKPRAFRRVVVRCPWGRPAVTEQAPYDESGEPFPTTYYLTCQYLVAAIARLEAAGGVERWSARAREEPSLRESLERANREQRELRPELPLGVGGAREGAGSLKCLHAHAAFALARPGYALGEAVLAEVGDLWPSSGCCTARPRSRIRRVPTTLDQTRREWEQAHRRLQQDVRESVRGEGLLREVDAVTAELRRRVGQTFTLAQLADAYATSDAWSREAVEETGPAAGWPRRLATVTDAAFHLYARGAVDYAP